MFLILRLNYFINSIVISLIIRSFFQSFNFLLFNKRKDIKREYGRNRYKSMSKEDKQKLKKYQKNYRKAMKKINYYEKYHHRKSLFGVCHIR